MKIRLQRLLETLNQGLIERETPLKLIVLSALAGENSLLIGPHGTAKSVLAERLHWAFKEGDYFERLLTRFSVPEELFGPLSIKSLENDQYRRLTENYLPSSSISFIDEIFKANSAILNALLTILNERQFDNGDKRYTIPLISVVAASNELPDEAGLSALYDRFLCRFQVDSVSSEQFHHLLRLTDEDFQAPDKADQLTLEEVHRIQQKITDITITDDVMDLLQAFRLHAETISLYISDRRWRKAVKLLKVAAYTNGSESVGVWECWLLQHCLWDEPEQREIIANWFETHLSLGSSGFNFERLDKLVSTWETVLHKDSTTEVAVLNEKGQPLYLNALGEQTAQASFMQRRERNGLPLYLAPPGQADRRLADQGYTYKELLEQFFDDRYQQTHIKGKWRHIDEYVADPDNVLITEVFNSPCMEFKQHERGFIEGRIRELSHLKQDIEQFKEKLIAQQCNLQTDIGEHLWLDPAFIITATNSLEKSIEQVESLLNRLSGLLDRYKNLPTTDE